MARATLLLVVATLVATSGCRAGDESDADKTITQSRPNTYCGAPRDLEDTTLTLPELAPFATLAVEDGVLVSGSRHDPTDQVDHLAVLKLHSSGEFDQTFGEDGYADFRALKFLPGVAHSAALAVDSQGRILLAGVTNGSVAGIGRLLPDGTIDDSFGQPLAAGSDVRTGTQLVPSDGEELAIRAIGVRPNGRIVIGGGSLWRYSASAYKLLQLTTDGDVDVEFLGIDVEGWRNLPKLAGSRSLAIHAANDGMTVAGGFGLWHFDANAAEPSRVTLPKNEDLHKGGARRALFDGSGAAVVAGMQNSRLTLTAFTASGQSDLNFGTDGVAMARFPWRPELSSWCPSWSQILGLAQTGSAHYVYHWFADRQYVTKFHPDGSLAEDYGDDGHFRIVGPYWRWELDDGAAIRDLHNDNLLAATDGHLIAVGFDHSGEETRSFTAIVPY